MFVRNQPWDGSNWRWAGKVHWMEGPFVTTCGRAVTDTWRTVKPDTMLTNGRQEICKLCQRNGGR